jgi:hypothetical protein
MRPTEPLKMSLDAAFITKLPYSIRTLVIVYYDGEDEAVCLQYGATAEETREDVYHHASWSYPVDQEVWIINKQAQPGKKLYLTFGGAGTVITPGAATGGNATAIHQLTLIAQGEKRRNKDALVSGQKAVPTTAEVVAADQAVPDGFAVVIHALDANTKPVFAGPAGITTSTGHQLGAGRDIGLYVSNVNLIYVVAEDALQKVSYIVEIPA